MTTVNKQELMDSIVEITDHAVAQSVATGLMDDSTGLFLQRETEYLKAKSYDYRFTKLTAREVFPRGGEVIPAGSSAWTYKQFKSVGEAQLGDIDGDISEVDVEMTPFTQGCTSIPITFSYNVDDINAAAMAKVSLPEKKAKAAVQAAETTLNRVAWLGDTKHNFTGFLQADKNGIPVETVGSWKTLNNDEILDQITDALAEVYSGIQENANTLALPSHKFKAVMNGKLSATYAGMTIGKWLKDNTEIEQIIDVRELAGAGAAGADRMVIMNQDPEFVSMEIPDELMYTPMEQRGLRYITSGRMRFGGVAVYQPLAHGFFDIPAA